MQYDDNNNNVVFGITQLYQADLFILSVNKYVIIPRYHLNSDKL